MNNDVSIMIPSSGRPDVHITLKSLTPEWLKRTYLVVNEREANAYESHLDDKYSDVSILPHPKSMRGIGRARDYLMRRAKTKYLVVLDDDVKFLVRRKERWDRLRDASPKEVGRGLKKIVSWLRKEKDVGQTGFSSQYANCFVPENHQYNQRCNIVWAINKEVYDDLGIRFNEMPWVLEDSNVTLRLLRSGYKNKILYTHAYADMLTNKKGGCSDYGTAKMWQTECRRLAEKHPGYVKVRLSRTPSLKAVGATYVTVSWKKAYNDWAKENEA